MSKIALVQFDDRNNQDLAPLGRLIERNALYAKLHGYHHAFIRQCEFDGPVYWTKVHLVRKYLQAGFEIVVWLDTDAVMHDFTVSIDSLFQQEEMFIFSMDLPIWQDISPFNAGVFFCKGKFAQELMAEWLSLYPAHLWERQGGHWNCKHEAWAGPAYEQGSFAEKLYPKYRSSPAFKQLPWKRLQNPYPLKDSITLHFQKLLRTNCYLYLNDLAETRTL